MGNCFETCTMRQEKGGAEESKDDEEVCCRIDGGLKVKILMTRGELEWLMLQLKEKGERKVEDVLIEIGRGREREREGGKYQGWRPTLESILEIPEVQGFDNIHI